MSPASSGLFPWLEAHGIACDLRTDIAATRIAHFEARRWPAGIVTLTKNGPNLLLDHEAKPLKMSISTIGESPRFRWEFD
jgi:hypothetical protein